VGLGPDAARKAGALDYGQLRLLTIAMALATAPRVLLLDEPLAGMGPEDGEAVAALLRDLARDHAVLLVEHDLDAVFSQADQVTVLAGGRVLLSGAPAAVRASAAVRDAFAQPPR
jgi:branched-chain amino acid transport system ATP-binding protein